MYCITEYSYIDRVHKIVAKGSKRDMTEYIESYILNFMDSKQGLKYKTFQESLKENDDKLSTKEWNSNKRYYVTRSNNLSKYIIKEMRKDVGYVYNSYRVNKIKSVYIVKTNNTNDIEYRDGTEFTSYESFDKVLDCIKKVNKEVKKVELDINQVYGTVVKELKSVFK